VAAAIDNEALADQLFEGLYPPTRELLAPTSPASGPTDYPPYDPAKARELAQSYERRTGAPISFTVLVPTEGEGSRVAQLAQKNLTEVGIDMQISTVEQTTLLTSVLLGQYQATAWLLFGDLSFETNNVFIHGDNVRPVGELSLDFTRLDEPTIDASLDRLRTTADVNSQTAASKAIDQQLGKLVPFVYLVRASGALAVKNTVHGIQAPTFPDGAPTMPLEVLNLWFASAWVEQ
jgi:peptide/nickel transport system substrate-binding protein